MAEFYTNFFLRGEKLHLRKVDAFGNKHQVKLPVSPVLYPRDPVGGFKSVFNVPLTEKQFHTVKEAKEFIKYQNDCYGFPRFEYTEIDDLFPGDGVEYDPEKITVAYIDIECELENGGFPDPTKAEERVNLITLDVNDTLYTFGLGDVDVDCTNYVYCKDEYTLLSKFLKFWRKVDPDILTGWNVETFDVPYLYNRIERIMGEGSGRKLSPWGFASVREFDMFGKTQQAIELSGLEILDYLVLYKKFVMGKKESYKLDFICELELGEKKLEYEGTMREFYRRDFKRFVEYNVRDVELVKRLDHKKRFIELVLTLAYSGKTNYGDVLQNVRMWDVIIANHLRHKGIHVPSVNKSRKDRAYEGAYVQQAQTGMYKWVASFDLTSLYPSLIIQYNISPETINKQLSMELHASDYINESERYKTRIKTAKENNLSMALNGTMYSKEEQGFIPYLADKYFKMRKECKGKMISAKKELQEINKQLEALDE